MYILSRAKRGFLFAVLFLLTALFLFYHLGRDIWYPVYMQLTGAQTVAEVIERLRETDASGIDATRFEQLCILAFKEEKLLEVWGRSTKGKIRKIAGYPLTGFSGSVGPKLREGDKQIPEGVYRIEALNPNSSYRLSLKLNYPNAFDREKGEEDDRHDLGSDIFIHGGRGAIGCIPIGDDAIEELFLWVYEVGKENVDVIIAPYDMRNKSKNIEVAAVQWESELYLRIEKAINERMPRPKEDAASDAASAQSE